ncbi:MAG: hypothetical protein ING01_00675 [Rhodobacter sp.]|nr:hypothetical protein [Rhodobacter sp.]MCA3470960.1 hypothetical protein [Rhodobacter sp.]
MDTATSDIRVVEFIPNSDGYTPVMPDVPDQFAEGEAIGTVTSRRHLSHQPIKHASVIPETFPLRPARTFSLKY